MKSLFHQLFDYNFYCNKKLIEQCTGLKKVPKKTRSLFSHILNAHHIWNMRLINKPWEYEVWQEHLLKDWQDLHYDNQRTTFEIINNTTDFEKRVDYQTTAGRVFGNEVKDILFHMVNHATHHRGQIVTNLRAKDIAPEPMDYIIYKR